MYHKILRRERRDYTGGQSDFFLLRESSTPLERYSVVICDRECLVMAENITSSRSVAERLFGMVCHEGLSPCHLDDLLEDELPIR